MALRYLVREVVSGYQGGSLTVLCRRCCIESAWSGLHQGTTSTEQHGVNTLPAWLFVSRRRGGEE